MKKKSRMLAAMLCAVLMVGVLTVPAYATFSFLYCPTCIVLLH